MAPALTGDVAGVLNAMLELYGAGTPDATRTAVPVATAAAASAGTSGAGVVRYTDATGLHSSLADSHARRDGTVGRVVGDAGNGTVDSRARLTDRIADFRARVQAIAAVGDTRFSGPALLGAAQATIADATRQVDADVAAARQRAAQIMPPVAPARTYNRRGTSSRRRNRTRSRYRSRSVERPRSDKRAVPSDGSAGSSAVNAANACVDLPYVWGGGGAGGPTGGGFDCSGLTQYAIAHGSNGEVVLPRTTYDQINSGIPVPRDQVRAGDLVFPRDSWGMRGPEHVQLAVDRNWVIEAPQPGQRVTWSRMPEEAVVIRVLPGREG